MEGYCCKTKTGGHRERRGLIARHGYEARGHEAEAKPKLLLNHEAEALTFWKHEAEAEALTFLKHEAEAEAEAQMLSSYFEAFMKHFFFKLFFNCIFVKTKMVPHCLKHIDKRLPWNFLSLPFRNKSKDLYRCSFQK